MARDFVKKPCQQCPFRRDVKPFLHPSRGEELAYSAQNPYNTFYCHKTIEHDDEGEGCMTGKSKVCAGFLTLQHNENGSTMYDDEGFVPSEGVYSDSWEMAEAYEEENRDERSTDDDEE